MVRVDRVHGHLRNRNPTEGSVMWCNEQSLHRTFNPDPQVQPGQMRQPWWGCFSSFRWHSVVTPSVQWRVILINYTLFVIASTTHTLRQIAVWLIGGRDMMETWKNWDKFEMRAHKVQKREFWLPWICWKLIWVSLHPSEEQYGMIQLQGVQHFIPNTSLLDSSTVEGQTTAWRAKR